MHKYILLRISNIECIRTQKILQYACITLLYPAFFSVVYYTVYGYFNALDISFFLNGAFLTIFFFIMDKEPITFWYALGIAPYLVVLGGWVLYGRFLNFALWLSAIHSFYGLFLIMGKYF